MIQNPKEKVITSLRGALAVGVVAAAFVALTAIAQDTNAPEKLKPTVVTGTYLESADAAGTLTVTPVELTQPINQGYSTVEDVLRTKLPQYGGPGNLNPAFGNGGDGNSYLALRGLPSDATLVLVNGRRTSVGALNLIPDAAVEKIEILNDGAGAIYGSDAVAGVVNIILKKNYQGTKLTASYLFNDRGKNVNERKFQLLSGVANDKGNITFSSEYAAADQLLSPDRRPSANSRGTSGTRNPGVQFNSADFGTHTAIDGANGEVVVPNAVALQWHVNPAVTRGLTNSSQVPAGFNPLAAVDTSFATNFTQVNALVAADIAARNAALGANPSVLYGAGARFPYPVYTTLYRPYTKYDFSAIGEYKLIGDTVQLFTDTYYVNYVSKVQLAPSPLTGLTIPGNNYWMQQVFPGTPSDAALSQNYRIVELGPRVYTDQYEDFHFVGGLKGKIPDTTWKWESAFLYDKTHQVQEAAGGVVSTSLDTLLAATGPSAWNPFTYTPIGSSSTLNNLSTLSGKAYLQYLTIVQGMDFNVSGNVIELPGGPLGTALGFAYRRESFDQVPDLATKDGLIFPFNQIPVFSGQRTIWSGYGEAIIPILGKDFNLPGFNELSVSGAARYEDYSDVGDTGVKPRVSARWKPLEKEAVSFRGSWAQGFSAPSLVDVGSPPSQNFYEVFNPLTQTYEQPMNGVFEEGNRNLKPVQSDTWLVGAEWAPKFIKGFVIGADYFNIKQTGVPFKSADYIVAQWNAAGGPNNPNNPFGPNAVPSGINPAGTQVQYDLTRNTFAEIRHLASINAGERKTDGVDMQVSQTFDTDIGKFTASGLATRVLTWEQQDVAGAPTIDYLGRYWGNSAALPDTGYPEWRANLTVAYEYKRWTAAVGWNFTSGYTESFDGVDRSVHEYITWDIRVGFKIPAIEATLLVGVNNLFDERPPEVLSSFENNFDRAIGDPRGRMVFFSLSKEF